MKRTAPCDAGRSVIASAPGARRGRPPRGVSRCAVCNRQAHHGHHIIYKQHFRRATTRLSECGTCATCCRSARPATRVITARSERIPARCCRAEALEFALEVGLDWLIEEYA
jgi:hypothetical protein